MCKRERNKSRQLRGCCACSSSAECLTEDEDRFISYTVLNGIVTHATIRREAIDILAGLFGDFKSKVWPQHEFLFKVGHTHECSIGLAMVLLSLLHG